MLKPHLLRELTLTPASHPHQRGWISAASGLVCVGNWAYVVADDEQHLARLRWNSPAASDEAEPLQLTRLFDGELPADAKQRKKAKADLETLVLLPAGKHLPHGALLAIGSGSKPNRCRGQVLPMTANGEIAVAARHTLDLHEWYQPLHKYFDDLNIEGAFVAQQQLRLLQRGNKGGNRSACLCYDYAEAESWLLHHHDQPPRLRSSIPLDFGSVDGVPLCPTDAAAVSNGRWLVSLVAEDTRDSYTDGRCIASAIAVMNSDNTVDQLHRLEGNPKVEGLAITSSSRSSLDLLMVTDADDPARPAQLLQVQLAL
jgi:hypothetical protein